MGSSLYVVVYLQHVCTFITEQPQSNVQCWSSVQIMTSAITHYPYHVCVCKLLNAHAYVHAARYYTTCSYIGRCCLVVLLKSIRVVSISWTMKHSSKVQQQQLFTLLSRWSHLCLPMPQPAVCQTHYSHGFWWPSSIYGCVWCG